MATPQERIDRALRIVGRCGNIPGDDHKMWLIDQMVRALTGCPVEEKTRVDDSGKSLTYEEQGESKEYLRFVHWVKTEWYTWGWDEGTPPDEGWDGEGDPDKPLERRP